MPSKKSIKLDEDVFETLIETKGDNTWSEHLNKLYQAAHGDLVKLEAPTLSDYTQQREGPLIGSIQTTADGEVELLFIQSNGTPVGIAQLSDLPEETEIKISLEKGSTGDK